MGDLFQQQQAARRFSEADEGDQSNQMMQQDLKRHLFQHAQDYYEQLTPPTPTWCVFILFVATDTFVIGTCIASFVCLMGEPYITPLTFTITVALFQALFAVLWVALYWRGLVAEYGAVRRVRIHEHGDVLNFPDTRQMDTTSMNFTDYQSWADYALLNRLGLFSLVMVALVVYTARFSGDTIDPASMVTSESAQAWFSTLLFVFTAYFWVYIMEFVAIWKYWTLVWSCYDPSVHKNPFFPYKRVLFN
jgi:hypothetical protein